MLNSKIKQRRLISCLRKSYQNQFRGQTFDGFSDTMAVVTAAQVSWYRRIKGSFIRKVSQNDFGDFSKYPPPLPPYDM